MKNEKAQIKKFCKLEGSIKQNGVKEIGVKY
jgi:hypothetical protein